MQEKETQKAYTLSPRRMLDGGNGRAYIDQTISFMPQKLLLIDRFVTLAIIKRTINNPKTFIVYDTI